jgi:hypothetical protein
MLNALMPGHRSRPALVIGLAVRYRCRPFLQVNILSDMSARSPWSWHADPCFGGCLILSSPARVRSDMADLCP